MTEQLNTNTYTLLKTPYHEFMEKMCNAAVSDWDYTGCAGLAGLKGEERCIWHIIQIAIQEKKLMLWVKTG